MYTRRVVAVVLTAVVTGACGKRIPEPANVAPRTPHVSWVIMSGDRDNPDREFVCQSDPRTDCVVPVSRADEQTFADVHIYYHGAGAETKYEGTIDVGFFQGVQAVRTMQTNLVVKKDESITNQSMTSIVTDTPRTYPVTFALTARVTDTGKTQPIRLSFPVIVK